MPLNRKIVSESELQPYARSHADSLRDRLAAFIAQQCATWPDLAAVRRELPGRVRRTLRLPHSQIELQCNPNRVRSATAKVKANDVAQRPCFLCPENLYPQQLGLRFAADWLILNNPFPIFRDHLVISSISHTDQLIEPALPAMIRLVADLKCGFSAFYNGARCGASAPDHLHFQACPAGMLPLERHMLPLLEESGTLCTPWWFETLDGRGIGLCRAASPAELLERLQGMCAHLTRAADPDREADINMIIFGRGTKLAGICLPRRAHRPACFFADDESRCVVSPGAVDIAGMVILPRQQDFERITGEQMLEIFQEVCLPADIMADF